MKRPLLGIIAVVIAGVITAAPVVTDVCRLDCARERPPECPLHQRAPHTCTHDHTIGTAGLTRASVDTSRPTDVAIAVTPSRAALAPASVVVSRIERQHAPPLRSPRPDVLRI
jgi:hypothetical protein